MSPQYGALQPTSGWYQCGSFGAPQVISTGFASWQRYCTALQYWTSAKLCGVEQRAPPIFGRAAITLVIGSHSSLQKYFVLLFSFLIHHVYIVRSYGVYIRCIRLYSDTWRRTRVSIVSCSTSSRGCLSTTVTTEWRSATPSDTRTSPSCRRLRCRLTATSVESGLTASVDNSPPPVPFTAPSLALILRP